MFAPPPPKAQPLTVAVAPYAADAAEKKRWERMQEKHRKAMGRVIKETDQTAPSCSTNLKLLRAREHGRCFQINEDQRKIGEENRRHLDHLSEIVLKPSGLTKMMTQKTPKVPQRAVEAQRRRQKAIDVENQHLVRRLLAIKTTLNRKSQEKDYKRHQVDCQRMKKIDPPGKPRRQRLDPPPPKGAPHAGLAAGALALERTWELPERPSSSSSSPAHDAMFRGSRSRLKLSPLPKSLVSSQSLPALGASESLPALGASAGGLTANAPMSMSMSMSQAAPLSSNDVEQVEERHEEEQLDESFERELDETSMVLRSPQKAWWRSGEAKKAPEAQENAPEAEADAADAGEPSNEEADAEKPSATPSNEAVARTSFHTAKVTSESWMTGVTNRSAWTIANEESVEGVSSEKLTELVDTMVDGVVARAEDSPKASEALAKEAGAATDAAGAGC